MDENKKKKNEAFASISVKSFITVAAILIITVIVSGALSYFVPQGEFLRDENGAIITGTYTEKGVEGIEIWRVITAPVRVFFSEDAVTIIMICVFLLIMSGIFNLLEKVGGIRVFISKIMAKMHDKGAPVVCVTVLVFMLFGSFFGMYEELITLLPIIMIFMLSLGFDTMTGLGACMLGACFGFSAAITNPFSVGLAAEVAGISLTDGVWLRGVFFYLIYSALAIFLIIHIRRVKKRPELSPTYEFDLERRKQLSDFSVKNINENGVVFRIFCVFFAIQGILLVLIATIREISDLAIPILAASFLIFGTAAGLIVSKKAAVVFKAILQGAVAMLPAVLMIALASSVKLIMSESGIIDTIMNYIIELLEGKSKFLALVLIYFFILFLQFFIGSASAKIILVMPILLPVASALGISPSLVILAYCMADGFSDVIIPTNPILLVGLSMAGVSYGKWFKWTWFLQLIVFIISMLVLGFGVMIGY